MKHIFAESNLRLRKRPGRKYLVGGAAAAFFEQ